MESNDKNILTKVTINYKADVVVLISLVLNNKACTILHGLWINMTN